MSNPYQKYKATSIQSASKEKLLLMLYEGAIKFCKKAVIAIENGDIAARGENVSRAYDIVLELMNTLDHKVGGEIAANLEQLYMFITDELTQANINNDVNRLNNAIRILTTLYDGWKQAIEQLKKNETKKASSSGG